MILTASTFTLWFNMNIGYHHNYISEVRPMTLPKAEMSETLVSADENTVPSLWSNAAIFYDYTRPVPRSEAVNADYFSDTVFIGDSRTKGLLMYTDISPLDFSGEGANVYSVQTKSYIRLKDENGEFRSYTLSEALKYKKGSYKAVYISLGLNELGWTADRYIATLESLIASVRQITDVPIYLQLILPVTSRAEATSQFGITNEKQKTFNERLIRLSAKLRVFRLDPISLFALDDGTLDPAHASDGIHLYPASYKILADYLRTHIVNTEMYADTRSEDPLWAPEGVFTTADNIKPIA